MLAEPYFFLRKGLGDVIFKKIPLNLESYFQQNSIIVVQWRTKSCPKRNYTPLPPPISPFLISEVSKWKTTSSLYRWHRKRNLSNEEAQCSFCAHEINVKWLRPLKRVEEHSLFKAGVRVEWNFWHCIFPSKRVRE